jgi:hypothetical protein
LNEIESAVAAFQQEVQALGETAFFEQLREDQEYWGQCRDRWGGGPGYKMDIRRWTDNWFDASKRDERDQFIEQELQRRWRDMMDNLDAQLASAEPSVEVSAA